MCSMCANWKVAHAKFSADLIITEAENIAFSATINFRIAESAILLGAHVPAVILDTKLPAISVVRAQEQHTATMV